MQVKDRTITADEFLTFANLPENAHRRLELLDGEIIEMAPSKKINTVVAGKIIRHLGNYVDENDLGYVTVPDGGYKLSTGRILMPDAAYIAKSRTDLQGIEFEAAPDLAVEVISSSESTPMIHRKARAYLESGTHQVWAVYPDDKEVEVIQLGEGNSLNIQLYGLEDTLDASPALEGFTLEVRKIFPET